MTHDFSRIKITKSSDGATAIDLQPFWEKHNELRDVELPDAFVKELERLAAMPYSDDLVDRIRDVAKRGYARAAQPEVTHYALHSMVRSRHNRVARAQAPQHARFKQHVLPEQRRLIRGRATIVTEAELKTNLEAFKAHQSNNVLEVRTMDGRLVNLDTFEVGLAPPVGLAPHPIPDSVANDIPTGIQFPKFLGDKVLSKEQVAQVVSGMASVDGDLKIDPKDGTAIVITEPSVFDEEVPLEQAEPEPVEQEELVEDEEELEDLPPGIPPPPPPPGGMPRHNKKKNRR